MAEKFMLINIVEKYKNIIENKKTDSNTWKEKEEAWEKVSEERKELFKTGGGMSKKGWKDETTDLVLGLMNKKTVLGLRNPFDSDKSAIENTIDSEEMPSFSKQGTKFANEIQELQVFEEIPSFSANRK
ncbi:hypothetical protein ABEB36_010761 [Hypothenemus hampei]|uniref:Regulatory protein zeste n=1 Tax=Hypothenemus hampei TaxID=57062 RepID=A0ABD1EDM4_HYPHA